MTEPQLRLVNIHVMQQTTDTQVVGWNLAQVGNATTDGASLQFLRSYAPNDGFSDVTPSPLPTVSQGFAQITESNLHDFWRIPYYKIVLTDGDSNTKTYGPVRLEGDLDGISLHLIKNIRTLLRLAGNPVLIYQRQFNEDDRCPACWDAVLKKVTLSNCTECFNTGFLSGYYAPLLTLAVITPEASTNDPGDTLRQHAATDALSLNYPVLRPRDLIYEVNTGRRYRVNSVQPIEKHRLLIYQQFTINRLNTTDVEHQITVPSPSTLTPLIKRIRGVNRSVLVANPDQDTPTITDLGI
jgi:hypothetical protein